MHSLDIVTAYVECPTVDNFINSTMLQLELGMSLEVDTIRSFVTECLQHVRIEDVLGPPGALLLHNTTNLNDRNTYDVTL